MTMITIDGDGFLIRSLLHSSHDRPSCFSCHEGPFFSDSYCTNIDQIKSLTGLTGMSGISFHMTVYGCATLQIGSKEANIHASFCMLMSRKIRTCAPISLEIDDGGLLAAESSV